ncbi:receptor-like protein 48 [Cannabis sativa]|uniref:receptor-like protein 48 n=1 Tax=Cannabis sativa TaxID=3483 RepID=UPI0029CA0F98|nr:receptor-like protein 48 [Cannabis sativa]
MPSSSLCHPHESSALLHFKNSFTIFNHSLSYLEYYGITNPNSTISWDISKDCYRWSGVTCDDITGHVIHLDLKCSGLEGILDSNNTLFSLSHLQSLILSWNEFYPSTISSEFGKFSNIVHLDLYGSGFSGQVPLQLSLDIVRDNSWCPDSGATLLTMQLINKSIWVGIIIGEGAISGTGTLTFQDHMGHHLGILLISISDFSPLFFAGMLEAVVAALLINIYIVCLYQLYDIDIDKVNKPYLPLASPEYSIQTGVTSRLLHALLSCYGKHLSKRILLFYYVFILNRNTTKLH